MQNKLAKILFSTRLTAVLFIVYAIAMATGTILDRNMDTSPTPYTRTLIYNAWWFEAIMVLFVVNFVGNISRYRLFRKEKWATLILHLAFILIIVGAAVTRYIGFEGMMPIREGETENTFLSQKTYISGFINGDYEINGVAQRLPFKSGVDFSPRLDNELTFKRTYDNQDVTFTLTKFIKNAEEDIVPDENGESYLKIVEAGNGQPHNHFLKSGGKAQNIHNVLFTLNNYQKGAVNIAVTNGQYTIDSPFDGEYLQMATMSKGILVKDSIQPLKLRSRYIIGKMQFVLPKPVTKGVFSIVEKSKMLKNGEEGVVFNVTSKGETKQINLLGGKGSSNNYKRVTVGGLEIDMRYGAEILELPFSIKLNDFEAERYPGTEKSYSSFSSKVTVLDEQKGDFDYKIFMNNILDHGGYRFFQSSFDPDEKGTILSVNHDFWGTWITYIGYFLLYIGLMVILVAKNTRFDDLKIQLAKIKNKKATLVALLFMFLSFGATAQEHDHHEGDGHNHTKPLLPTKQQIDSILVANVAPLEHANKFGRMVVQDVGGRMMPVNTYSSEFLRKLSKSDTYAGLTSDQVYLSIHESPLLWYNVPVIYLKSRKADSIRKVIGVQKTVKHATLADFFTDRGAYKLEPFLEEAYKAQIPNGFQKEIKEVDVRVNLLYNAIEGKTLRIFPVPNDYNNKWISPSEFRDETYREKIKDSLYANFISNGVSAYLVTLDQAKSNGNYSQADALLTSFKKTQERFGKSVMISDQKINAEITYNKYDIFKKLFSWYMYAGSLMFVFIIIQIFKEKSKAINLAITVFKGIIIALFLLHTGGLIARWYISGHAPWSDAYESMIYVAWATMLFGLLMGSAKEVKIESKIVKALLSVFTYTFYRKTSDLTIAAGAFVTSMILMIAHWNWMDPAIANLQPVLNSYWLMIHVAVIVASYGPFTLGMILGVVALLLMILTTKKNKEKMLLNIKELTVINEMALTVGLVMLTIGNFLGGQWANESWGRYWGWDPKETWALISIMFYAFVIHARLVPGLRGRWFFNLMSIIAFGSILMTYFGVNFYLSGLHSYASGDQILSFQFIAVTLCAVAVLGGFSYYKYAKYFKK